MDIEGCLTKEIIIEPILASGFEDAVTRALLYAIERDVNITVTHHKDTIHIVPRSILRDLFAQIPTESMGD